ncbi:hypothetical protein EZV62_007015 [Acer yangbiense]|uniref:Disease resistance protein At4g27190-like leucine-rich repeats domain-containing protein n=1 Tax=Acer yangbiense TaxID=1000413 RepID=A0A5C7I8N4_9ROSI|nr:hypothetical protein EZV62_007015 [Acer yangbiense]
MVEVGVSVAAKIAEYLVAPIVRPFSYIWNYKTNFQNLEMEVRKLKGRRDTVQQMADEARRNAEEIEEHETWIPSYKGYEAFESRMPTLKNILDALSNPDVKMVGIYGSGGIGKTMLAREIAGQAEDKKLFDVIAFAKVAVKPDINNFQEINEGQHDSSVQPLFMVEKVTFPSLEEIKISQSNNLKMFSMPRLLTVGVSGCALLEENFDLQKIFDLQNVNFEESHSGAITQQLQELYISRLPKLKHIWNKDPQAVLFFKSLQKVEVYNCQNLKDVFPASIGRSLLQLVKLNVYDCGKLEEIVAKEGEAKAAVRFVFPEELEVVGCDKIELLASELFSFQENNEESHLEIPAQQPLFLVEKDSFPYLEKLILGGKAIKMMILLGQFSEELFCNLKFFKVQDKESVVFPLCILQGFRHLQNLCLESCSYKEIFSYQEDETHVWIDSKLDTVLQKLESLEVEGCHNLIQLWPSSASFQNLTFLRVWHCNGLKNLMTSSTAKSLVQLRKMIIRQCNSMIEVVTKEGNVTEEDEITFSKLRSLTLDDLPKLSCFCSENCTFKLPSLEKLTLYSCPEMKCFSSRDVTTPILQTVKGHWSDRRVYKLKGDLNTSIQQIQGRNILVSIRIRHLQKLHLESSSYKEIFSYEDDETDVENLIKLVPSSVAMD